jgi:hypothetical protein
MNDAPAEMIGGMAMGLSIALAGGANPAPLWANVCTFA